MGRAAARLDRTATKLRSLPEQGVQASVKLVQPIVLRELRTDAGPDQTLSGVRNGVAQTVEVKTESRVGSQYAAGRVKAGPQRQRAPWFWMNDGTEPGQRKARRRRATGQTGRGGGNHPGTPAKHTWDRAAAQFVPKVRATFEQLFTKAVDG